MGSFNGQRTVGGGKDEGLIPISYSSPTFAGIDNVEFEGNKVPGNLNRNLRPTDRFNAGGSGGLESMPELKVYTTQNGNIVQILTSFGWW